MRLITFQPVSVLLDICTSSVYYPEENVSRMKVMDSKYKNPVYTFATLSGKPICFRAVAEGMSEIQSVGSLISRVMLELEVSESDILSMKKCTLYEEYNL